MMVLLVYPEIESEASQTHLFLGTDKFGIIQALNYESNS